MAVIRKLKSKPQCKGGSPYLDGRPPHYEEQIKNFTELFGEEVIIDKRLEQYFDYFDWYLAAIYFLPKWALEEYFEITAKKMKNIDNIDDLPIPTLIAKRQMMLCQTFLHLAIEF